MKPCIVTIEQGRKSTPIFVGFGGNKGLSLSYVPLLECYSWDVDKWLKKMEIKIAL